jgi:hypothetical protein
MISLNRQIAQIIHFFKNSKKMELILFYTIALLPIVDILNGIFINYLHVGVTPGLVIRPLLLGLFFIYVVLFNKKYIRFILIFIALISLSSFYQIGRGHFSISDLSYHLKLIYNMFYFVVIYSAIKIKILRLERLYKALMVSLVIILSSLIFSFITGTSLSSYSDSGYTMLGIKGYFESLNSLSAVLSIMLPVVVGFIYHSKKRVGYVLVYLLTSVFLLLLGTKTGIIACALTPLILVSFSIFKFGLKNRLNIIILSTIGVSFFIVLLFFRNVVLEIVSRQLYFFQRNDLLSYFLSQRNTGLQVIFENLNTNFHLGDFLFGFGLEYGKAFINERGAVTIEMDYFDIFHYSGFLLMSIFLILYSGMLFASVLLYIKRQNIESLSLGISFIYAFVLSTLGGHVLTDTFAGLYISTVGAIVLTELMKEYQINSGYELVQKLKPGRVPNN